MLIKIKVVDIEANLKRGNIVDWIVFKKPSELFGCDGVRKGNIT